METANGWSIVYGPSQSGKSYRWLVGAHELSDADAIIWIDLKNAKSSNDVLSTIASQLSLSVLSLSDVMLEFQRLLGSYLERCLCHGRPLHLPISLEYSTSPLKAFDLIAMPYPS